MLLLPGAGAASLGNLWRQAATSLAPSSSGRPFPSTSSVCCRAFEKKSATAIAFKPGVREEDAFVSAALRLQEILEGVRW